MVDRRYRWRPRRVSADARPRRRTAKPMAQPGQTGGAADASVFALFVAIFVRVSAWERDQTLLEFRLLSREIVDKINADLAEQEVFLEQLERSFTRPAPVSRAEFRPLAKHLLRRFSTIQAVKWA